MNIPIKVENFSSEKPPLYQSVDLLRLIGLLVLYLCKAIPEEVIDLGLNKYGTEGELAAFTKWLR
jgi:hypothetical protein